MSLLTPTILSHLETLYSQPSRHYHGLSHINSLLSLYDAHRAEFSDSEAIEAAIWFHDAIYDAKAAPPSNELASAQLAVSYLLRDASIDPGRLERIKKMIEATAMHTVHPADFQDDEGAIRDAEMFLDMDLSILGADEKGFDEYEAGVRKEYAHVSKEQWRDGRKRVLEAFLTRRWIYHSELFRGLLEEKARRNLKRSVERLGGTVSDEVASVRVSKEVC